MKFLSKVVELLLPAKASTPEVAEPAVLETAETQESAKVFKAQRKARRAARNASKPTKGARRNMKAEAIAAIDPTDSNRVARAKLKEAGIGSNRAGRLVKAAKIKAGVYKGPDTSYVSPDPTGVASTLDGSKLHSELRKELKGKGFSNKDAAPIIHEAKELYKKAEEERIAKEKAAAEAKAKAEAEAKKRAEEEAALKAMEAADGQSA